MVLSTSRSGNLALPPFVEEPQFTEPKFDKCYKSSVFHPSQSPQNNVIISASSDRSASGFSYSPPTRFKVSLNKSLASLSVLPGGPPIGNRVIVTLSGELSADISAQKVRLIKSKQQIRIDKYSFKNQSREQLRKRLPEDAIISGVVYLPKGLEVLIGSASTDENPKPDSVSDGIPLNSQGIQQESDVVEKNWKSIEQVVSLISLENYTI